jgi:hypothetical protein
MTIMQALLGSGPTNRTLTGVQSNSGCYSGQGGFSVDIINNVITLTMGVWPSDPPNCQTCSWQWLQFNGRGANNLANNTTSNIYRTSTSTTPYWVSTWTLNISAMSVGSTVYTKSPFSAYSFVSYTYAVTRTGTKSIGIVPYPNSWSTGDTGTTISIQAWWDNVVLLGGGTLPSKGVPAVLGQINLSW